MYLIYEEMKLTLPLAYFKKNNAKGKKHSLKGKY